MSTGADFLFVGLGILPAVLAAGGAFGPALLVFIPLLLAACLWSAWESVAIEAGEPGNDRDAPGPSSH
jgi:hypothetical protein